MTGGRTGTTYRGRHKIFLGMAVGVGKTCRMLQEGQRSLVDRIIETAPTLQLSLVGDPEPSQATSR